MKRIKTQFIKCIFIVLLLFTFNNTYSQVDACITFPTADLIKCRWDSITLSAKNCANPTIYDEYSWVNLSHPDYPFVPIFNGQAYKTRDSGYWEVTIKNTLTSAIDKDTVHISYKPEPLFDIRSAYSGATPNPLLAPKCAQTARTLNATINANINNYKWYIDWSSPIATNSSSYTINNQSNSTYYWVTADYSITGCLVMDSIFVPSFESSTPNLGKDTAICSGQSIVLKANGLPSTSSFDFGWQTNNPQNGTPNSYTVTTTDQYIVRVKGPLPYDCISTDTINVTVNPTPVVTSVANTLICYGNSVSLNANASGATGTFKFAWSPKTSINDTTLQSPTVNPTSTITYTVTAKAQTGCIGVSTSTITVNPKITTSVGFKDSTVCPGSSIKLLANASGGTAPFNYSWSPVYNIINGLTPTPEVSPLVDTMYVVTVKDSKNCSKKDSLNIDILWVKLPGDKDTLGTIGIPIVLNAYNTSTDGFSFRWEDTSGTVLGNTPTLSINTTGVYVVSVYNGSCMVTDTMKVTFFTEIIQSVWLPNVFNPGLTEANNSHLRVYGNNISNANFLFRVYSQWGKLIYETTSTHEAQNKGWNGMENNSGEALSTGVYTYTVTGEFFDGKKFEKTGMVTLMR